MGARKSNLEIITQILEIISSAPAVTVPEILEKTGLSYATLHRNLEIIEKIQRFPKIKKRKSGRNLIFYCD